MSTHVPLTKKERRTLKRRLNLLDEPDLGDRDELLLAYVTLKAWEHNSLTSNASLTISILALASTAIIGAASGNPTLGLLLIAYLCGAALIAAVTFATIRKGAATAAVKAIIERRIRLADDSNNRKSINRTEMPTPSKGGRSLLRRLLSSQ